jgi:hypothetical protein
VLEGVLDIAGGRLLVDKLRYLQVGEHVLVEPKDPRGF